MSDKPILFSGPMVRAILEGRKTQTRRVLKPQPKMGEFQGVLTDTNEALFGHTDITRHCQAIRIPYAPGDRLWVREAWRTSPAYDDLKPSDLGGDESIFYEDGTWESWGWGDLGCVSGGRNRQSMFMPRWASRMTLTVTDVRVQRLQDISERDAIAEGIADGGCTECGGSSLAPEGCCYNPSPDFREGFAFLWDSLNYKRGYGWDANPWVCAVTFTVHRCNIDQMETL